MILVIVALAVPLPNASRAGAAAPAGCADGPLRSASVALVHPSAEVVRRDRLGGFETALVLEPVMHPGVRHRLIRAGDRWCEASALNIAWRLAGRPADGVAMAEAFASLAAAPYFDEVTILDVDRAAPGVFSLETHALTNGIRARWTISVDRAGVRAARWTATDFAVRPFVGEWEGLTATPGVERSYLRDGGGIVRAEQPVLPQLPADPEVITEGRTVDDFIIRVSTAGTDVSPNAGVDTGVYDLDFVRLVRKTALSNYNEFHAWGLRKNWSSNVGIIYVDASTYTTCLACVYERSTFNIYINSQILRIFESVGWEYPDEEQALATIIGHEMFHNWQHAKGVDLSSLGWSAFTEGTARMQETLHDYSEVSHQPSSLVYYDGRDDLLLVSAYNVGSSCNGWLRDDDDHAFAKGLFTGQWYSACYFWLPWFDRHGTEGLIGLLEVIAHHQDKPFSWPAFRAVIEDASGAPVEDELAAFAAASLTGRGYRWAPPAGGASELDWADHLQRWIPPTMRVGQEASAALRDGGLISRQLLDGGTLSIASTQPGAALYVVRDDGARTTWRFLDATDPDEDFSVAAPAEGERVWAVGVHPDMGTSLVSLALDPEAS